MITMTYFHTVVVFAGSSDPVKVTSYTQAEQQDYESGLPVDATVVYSGTSARDMRAAFVGSKSASPPSPADLQQRETEEYHLRRIQRYPSKDPNEVSKIHQIVTRAYWN